MLMSRRSSSNAWMEVAFPSSVWSRHTNPDAASAIALSGSSAATKPAIAASSSGSLKRAMFSWARWCDPTRGSVTPSSGRSRTRRPSDGAHNFRPNPAPGGTWFGPPHYPRGSARARRDRGPTGDRGARRARVRGPHGALRGFHRPLLARQREVGRLRRGLRLLRPVALRRGADADARDDVARADPRARAGRRGGWSAPLLHGHAGARALEARLLERARGRAPRGRAHEPQALCV